MDTKKQKTRYRALQYATFAGEFVSVLTPFVAIGISNYDKYFVQYNGTKMSIAFFMAMAVMGIAVWGIAKQKLKNSYVSMIIMWATFAFIFQMMGSIITDLAMIMWCGLAGLVTASGLDFVSAKMKSKAEAIDKARDIATQEELVAQVKEERKTVKVKVKKKHE